MPKAAPWTAETRPKAHRHKGVPNKLTSDLKAMIEGALERAGGLDYLAEQAHENPPAFMALVGKLLPKDMKLDVGGGIAAFVEAVSAARKEPSA